MNNKEKLDDLDIRIANLEIALDIIKQELNICLCDKQEIIEIMKYKPVGFIIKNCGDVKQTGKQGKQTKK
jgi:hypothetical protein